MRKTSSARKKTWEIDHQRLQKLVEDRAIPEVALVKKVGCSQRALQLWLSGKQEPLFQSARELSSALTHFGCSASELDECRLWFGGTEPSDPAQTQAGAEPHDFTNVGEELKRQRRGATAQASLTAFYNGNRPRWADIVQEADSSRDQTAELIEFLRRSVDASAGEIVVAVALGEPGCGKSTGLMRAAADLTQDGRLVLFQSDQSTSLRTHWQRNVAGDDPVFIFIDKPQCVEASDFRNFIDSLHRQSIWAVVVVAAWPSIWAEYCPSRSVARSQTFPFGEWTDDDIDRYLDKLAASLPGALGTLAGRPRPQQIEVFRSTNRSFLRTMLEAKRSEPFENYVADELEHLPQLVRRAYVYVSAFARFDLAVPEELLQKLVPGCDIDDDILYRAHGLLERSGGYITTPRHTEWCELALAADARRNPQTNRYETIIKKSPSQYERDIARLLNSLAWRDDSEAEHLLEFAYRCFRSSVFPHIMSKHRKRRGDLAGARKSLEFSVSEGVADAATFQALGVLEKEDAERCRKEGRLEESYRFIDRARELLRRAIEEDKHQPHAWTELGLLERDQGNLGTIDEPWSARGVFKRAYDTVGEHYPLIRAWMIVENAAADCHIGRSVNDKYSVRWLYDKLTRIPHPELSVTYGNWAAFERNVFEKTPSAARCPAEVRLLWEESRRLDPKNVATLVTWAAFERDLIKADSSEKLPVERVRSMYEDASRLDPKNVATLVTWAAFERDLIKAGSSEKLPFKRVRSMFEAALQLEPANEHTWKAYLRFETVAYRAGSPISYSEDGITTIAAGIAPTNVALWRIVARSPRWAVWFTLQLAQNGFAEHAEALAAELARSSNLKQFEGWTLKISHLSHLARLSRRAGPVCVREFIQCALNSQSDNWLAKQYKLCPPGPLAGALFSLWAYLDAETVELFVQDALAARLGQVTRGLPSAPTNQRSAILQLIGVCDLLAVEPEPSALSSFTTESIEQILQFAALPDDAAYLGHIQIQLWLGLRWIAQRLSQERRISPDVGNRTLELLRKEEPNTDRQRSLRDGMIEWMIRCRENNWTLVRD